MGKVILIADADESSRDALKASLGTTHSLIVVGSGPQALRVLKTNQQITTLFLGLDDAAEGLDLVGQIRSDHPDVKLVAMVGRKHDADGEAAVKHGAHGYVVKPLSPQEAVNLAG